MSKRVPLSRQRSTAAVWLWVLCAVAIQARTARCGDSHTTNVLAVRMESFLAESDLSSGQVSVIFRAGSSGRTLFARNPDLPLKPASNNKILTSAAALSHLGPHFRFQTLVAMRGRQHNGTLHGDLVVVGAGDPTISGRFTENHERTAIFCEWAKTIRKRNIKRVSGSVVGIDDAFDDVAQAPGWPAEDRGEWYCAEISALAFNDSCVDLRWTGANGKDHEPARFELIPPTRYVRIVNFVTTAREGGEFDRFYYRQAGSNTITVRGRVGRGQEVYDSAAISNPTLYFVTVFAEVLKKAGIEIDGGPRDIDEFEDKSIFRESLTPLAVYESPPLVELLNVVNRNSHNFYAEQILKTMGMRIEGEGSFAAGTRVVRRYLESIDVDTRGMTLVDGSGLSRRNRATAAQIAAVLLAVDATENGPLFRNTLPLGGRTGSLRKRFRADAGLREVAPRVRAKTGYIRGCHALSGWVETRAGQSICFSALCNDLPMTDYHTKVFLERLVAIAADLKEKI